MNKSRIFAKVLDYSLFYSFILLFSSSVIFNCIGFIALPFLFAPIEAFFLKFTKGTLGQWIFGICLSKKVSFPQALKFSFKKAALIFPLMFAPLNIFFAIFYLRETQENQNKRWNISDTIYYNKTRRNPFLKYCALFLSIITLLFNYSPSSFKSDIVSITKQEINVKNWVEVKNSDLKFSVYFPKKPLIEKKDVEVKEQNTTLNVTEYTHDDHISYYLQSTKVPSSWTFLGSKYLFKALTKALETHQGKVLSKSFKKHGSYPCMEYLLDNHKKGQTKGILILVGKKLYKLEVQSKKKLSETELAAGDEFISTFSLN